MGILQVIITYLMLLLSYWTLALRNNEAYRDGTMDISNTLDARLTTLVKEIRARYENSPDEDRKDSCSMDEKETESNGVFNWTSTTVGMRRYVKCPYADDDEELYAFRDCLPNDEHIPQWTAHNISDCPGPPLGRKMNKYANQTMRERENITLEYWGQYLQEVYDITEKHPDAPVSASDIDILVSVFEDYIDYIDDIKQTPGPVNNSRNILLLSDYAMAQWPLADGLKNITSIRMLEVMTTIIKNLPVNTKLGKPTHQYLLNMTTVEQSPVGPQSSCFGIDTQNFTDERCRVEVEVNFPKNGAELKTLVIADNYPSVFVFHIYEPSMQVIELPINTSGLYDGLPAPTPSKLPLPQPNKSLTVLEISSPDSSTVGYPANNPDIFRSTSDIVTNPELDPSIDRVEMKYEADKVNRRYVAWGPLVYITSSSVVEDVILTFKLRDRWGKEKSHLFKGTEMCGNLEESKALLGNGRSPVWDPDLCVTETATETYRHNTGLPEEVTCRCRATTGYFGVFVAHVGYLREKPVSPTNPPNDGGLDKLMGFESHYEIDVTNHVLRALSFVCLLLTVATYIAFRKLRQSSSVSILINLCVALIALNVVLYISGGIAHTKMGCRASHILTYYFILVTLLWNAVEAANMYLKLVKVFGSHKSKITRKAAAVAWGLPLIPVIILLAVDKSSFDGYDVDLKFRCLLKKHILHYALLVPIGVIMLFNFIIFGFALSIIIKLGKARTNQGKRRMWLTKLLGAVALLVLLGVPWIFSAFGAIDPKGDRKLELVELIFQVIFVVLFNLQGIFIFLFHGVRNKEARGEWRSSVSWLSTSAGRVASQTDSQLQSSPGRTSACNQPNTNTTSTDTM